VAGEILLKVVVPYIVPSDGSIKRSDGKEGVIEKVVFTGSSTIIHEISTTSVVAKL
jgi:hypothetical protein